MFCCLPVSSMLRKIEYVTKKTNINFKLQVWKWIFLPLFLFLVHTLYFMPSFFFFEISSSYLIYLGNSLLACQKICKAWIKGPACWLSGAINRITDAYFLAYFLSPAISTIIHIREIFSYRKKRSQDQDSWGSLQEM